MEVAKHDLAQLQGEWSLASGNAGGQDLPANLLKNSRRVCKGDETTVVVAGELLMKAKFILDPSKTPKAIDYKVTAGPNAGKSQLGIYELTGDSVKFCFAAPGKDRPKDFTNPSRRRPHVIGLEARNEMSVKRTDRCT